MDDDTLSVTEAAALAGVPRGTLSSWRSRGHATRLAGFPDVVGLALIRELSDLGLSVAAAAGIAEAARGRWGAVHNSKRRVFLVAQPAGDGRWRAGLYRGDAMPAVGAGVVVEVTRLVREVSERVLATAPRRRARRVRQAS